MCVFALERLLDNSDMYIYPMMIVSYNYSDFNAFQNYFKKI